jgi:hypothetical protein
MPNFRRFLSRRWIFAGVIVMIALPMLHPFVRQSIIGPTIDGIPWCVWEDEARRRADPSPPPETWFHQVMRRFGFMQRNDNPTVDVQSAAALPLHLYLADDRDAKVRRFALRMLAMRLPAHEAEVTPVFRRHLEDDDSGCRLSAAQGVWFAAKDLRVKAVLLPLLNENDVDMRRDAVCALGEMANSAPDLFEPFLKLTEDKDDLVRRQSLIIMGHFGKRSVPILQQALHDPSADMRQLAIHATSIMGKNGKELIPILQALVMDDPVPQIRHDAAHALHKLDAKKFSKPAAGKD